MNRIILAYCSANADLAGEIDRDLSRLGIPFEHVTEASGEQSIAKTVLQSEEPAVLLLSDNLLKNSACLTGLYAALQSGGKQNLAILCTPGKDDQGRPVETHIDRMVNALHYMNFWQNRWLDLNGQLRGLQGEERESLNTELENIHDIANHIGDLVAAVRTAGYISYEEFKARDYLYFFQKYRLEDWYPQYQRLQQLETQGEGPAKIVEIPVYENGIASATETFVPPAESTATLPPIQQETPPFVMEEMEETMEDADHELIDNLVVDQSAMGETVSEADVIMATIKDARDWIDHGYAERGLELLGVARAQYPENTALAAVWDDVQAKIAAQHAANKMPETKETPAPVESPKEKDAATIDSGEAKSYEVMGDMAAEKGDYLFAKYCWDRCAEIDPDYPGIYKKLGLTTSAHLRDYQETSVSYLEKALQQNAEDASSMAALAQIYAENSPEKARSLYFQAISIDPSQKSPELEALFVPTTAPEAQIIPTIESPVWTEPAEEIVYETRQTAEPIKPAPEKVLTILITGATSGIGLATAELFARHGHRLILTGRRVDRLSALKSRLEDAGQTDMLMLPFDVRDEGATEAALNHLPESWREVDVLINNAGLAKGLAPIHEGDLDHWNTMIDTNVKGLLYVTRCIAPGMVARRRGHIINVGSIAGKEVYPNGNVYCASKFAVDGLTRAMRHDLYKHNIRVSQVSPGHVEETEFALTRFDGDAARANIYSDFQPLKASDVAEAIYFMVTRPAHVNIQDIVLYGTQQAGPTSIDRSGRNEVL